MRTSLLLLVVALVAPGCRTRTFLYYVYEKPGTTEADYYQALKSCTAGRDNAETQVSDGLNVASRKGVGVPGAMTPGAMRTVDLCMRVAGWDLNEIRFRHRPPLGSMILGQPEPRVITSRVR